MRQLHLAPRCTIDYETRSACNIKTRGTWAYSTHPSTQILCLVFRLPYWKTGRVSVWHPALPTLGLTEEGDAEELTELFDWISEGGLVEAHNAFFEFCIWRNIQVRQYGWPAIPHAQWRCSAAKAAAHALPRALENAAVVLRLPQQKDDEGSKVMKKMAKPRKSRKKERETWARDGVKPPRYLWFESYELLDRLIAYCAQDVLTEEALSEHLPDLTDDEQRMFEMDLRMNEQGFQIDREAVKAALTLIHRETVILNQELSVITGGQVKRATQRARMLAWFEAQGFPLPDTQKGTIDEVLTSGAELADPVRRALEVIRTLGRSSTAKYQAMKHWMARDGRVRGGLLYHGASTGRWAGKGIQPHNFPKGGLFSPDGQPVKVTQDDLWAVLKRGHRPEIVSLFRNVMEALATGLRGAITAAPGHQLYVADYASIEARVLLWLAGDEEGLDVFRSGRDIYCEMASAIYNRPITKADKDERQLGKAAVLGCFGANTLVLTDRGWLPIITVTPQDKVWDGAEWVCHDGVVNQGRQEAISWLGVHVTPNHKILVKDQWFDAQYLAQSENATLQQLALSSVNLPWSAMPWVNGVGCGASESPVPAGSKTIPWPNITCVGERLLDVTPVPRINPSPLESISGAMPTSFPTMPTEHDFSTASVPSSLAASAQQPRNIETMVGVAFESGLSGWLDMGQERVELTVEPRFSGISLPYPDGTGLNLNSTGRITTEGTNPAISISSLEKPTSTIDVNSGILSSESGILRTVYDIVNAGRRHRFTILTNAGPLIVSNCGYQMGGSKFVATAAMYGVTIEEDFSTEVVRAYREKFWRVKALWTDQEASAMEAVTTKRLVECGRISWKVEGQFLYAILPSGRRLAYAFPRVEMKRTPWGEAKGLSFMAVDGYTRRWRRQPTYGGMIVENLTQAVARDLMAYAMLRAQDSSSYRVILSVHDELVSEAPEGVGDVKAFEQLMAECPEWADGCPVEAAGWRGFRYAKN